MHNNIQQLMQDAMKAKDTVRLSTLRGLLSAFTNELVSKGRKPIEKLNDEEVLDVIRRSAKQRKDSIEQFKSGGRNDLVESEEAELKILEGFLPQMMSEEEILPLASLKKAELGITDKSKAGILVGALMKDLRGQADGGVVKNIVDSLF